MTKKETKKRLSWKHCKCGCLGSSVKIGPLYYWRFKNPNGNIYLNTGHDWLGEHLGCFSSNVDVDREVLSHAKQRIKKFRNYEKYRNIIAAQRLTYSRFFG